MEESANMSTETNDIGDTVNIDGDCKTQLENQSKQLAEEFNAQRAKMKELFLQKEEEMRRVVSEKQQLQSEVVGLRSQLEELNTITQNQKHELESLQMLIHETVASSSACSDEMRQLQARNLELEQQVSQLTKQQASQDAVAGSLAPAALVQTVTRSIARKLGADSDDDAAKKIQEESELLRPREEEIKALKDKLREADNQLQMVMAQSSKPENKERGASCPMCANYEKQLVAEQAGAAAAQQLARRHERALQIAIEELEGARSIHDETVRSWRAERATSIAAIEELRAQVDSCKQAVDSKASIAEEDSRLALERVTALTVKRQTLQDKLDTLEKDNATLVGEYTKKAIELQNEDINLPDTVEELQEYALLLREELIVLSMARESCRREEKELRAQLLEQTHLFHEQAARHASLHALCQQLRQQMDTLEAERAQMNELGDKLRASNDRVEELLNDKTRLQREAQEMRARVLALQQQLDTSEKVQQDFVRLSQSLQVQLERIRAAETELRWQHDEDALECPACGVALAPSSSAPAPRKAHCRHCGRVFCAPCAGHEVRAGPRGRVARVCLVCRTLLLPHAAPYFSTQPPDAHDAHDAPG